ESEHMGEDMEAEAGTSHVDKTSTCRIACHRFFMKELLDAVLELITLFPTDIFDPRPIMRQQVVLHGDLELGVIEPIELEREEQKMRRDGRDAFLHVGVEFAARGIG